MAYLGAKVEGRHTADFILTEGNGFISRDAITVAISAKIEPGTVLGKVTASEKFVVLDEAAADGSEVAAGILYAAVDATAADVNAVGVVRQAELIGDQLIWPGGISANDKTTAIGQLADHDLIVR